MPDTTTIEKELYYGRQQSRKHLESCVAEATIERNKFPAP